MGWTWEIEVWTMKADGQYGYEPYWSGNSAVQAFLNMRKAKKAGYGCVTLHWR